MADTNDEESGTKSSVATTEIPPVATAQDDSLQPLESAEPPKELTLPVVFKKRRKLAHHYQRRPVDNENDAKEGASDDNSQALVKETPTVVRRPPRPQPKHGFIVSTRAPDYSMIATADELNAQPAPDPLAGRFVKSSGQVLDKDDKLLNAYVEAGMRQLFKNPNGPVPDPWALPTTTLPPSTEKPASTSASTTITTSPQTAASSNALVRPQISESGKRNIRVPTADERQAASMGKVVEVDLGPEAREANIRRTEAALRRLRGEVPLEDPGKSLPHGRKRALRGIKRRSSADEERDRKIEEFMKEAPVYHFDIPKNAPDSDLPTDDVLAAQFEKEFLEQQENNARHHRKPQNPGGKGAADERAKGPKLGGSRSARAQMRAREEEDKKKEEVKR